MFDVCQFPVFIVSSAKKPHSNSLNLYFLFLFYTGLMPYNFLCVRAGCMLSQIKSLEDMLSLWAMFQLAILALVALVPGLVIKSLHQRYQKTEAQKASQLQYLIYPFVCITDW